MDPNALVVGGCAGVDVAPPNPKEVVGCVDAAPNEPKPVVAGLGAPNVLVEVWLNEKGVDIWGCCTDGVAPKAGVCVAAPKAGVALVCAGCPKAGVPNALPVAFTGCPNMPPPPAPG